MQLFFCFKTINYALFYHANFSFLNVERLLSRQDLHTNTQRFAGNWKISKAIWLYEIFSLRLPRRPEIFLINSTLQFFTCMPIPITTNDASAMYLSNTERRRQQTTGLAQPTQTGVSLQGKVHGAVVTITRKRYMELGNCLNHRLITREAPVYVRLDNNTHAFYLFLFLQCRPQIGHNLWIR